MDALSNIVELMLCLLYGGGGCSGDRLLFTMPVRINISKGSSASLNMEQM
jgi:hypothetical protein